MESNVSVCLKPPAMYYICIICPSMLVSKKAVIIYAFLVWGGLWWIMMHRVTPRCFSQSQKREQTSKNQCTAYLEWGIPVDSHHIIVSEDGTHVDFVFFAWDIRCYDSSVCTFGGWCQESWHLCGSPSGSQGDTCGSPLRTVSLRSQTAAALITSDVTSPATSGDTSAVVRSYDSASTWDLECRWITYHPSLPTDHWKTPIWILEGILIYLIFVHHIWLFPFELSWATFSSITSALWLA